MVEQAPLRGAVGCLACEAQQAREVDGLHRQRQVGRQPLCKPKVLRRGRNQELRHGDGAELPLEIVQRALQLQRRALKRFAARGLVGTRERLQAEFQPSREEQLGAVVDRQQPPVLREVDQRHAAVARLGERGDVALAGFRNVDRLQGDAGGLEAPDAFADERIGRAHREHVVARARAALAEGNVEHVDGRVRDVIVEHVLDAPAHRGLQLGGGNVRRFDLEHLVFARRHQRRAAVSVHVQFLRDALRGGRAADERPRPERLHRGAGGTGTRVHVIEDVGRERQGQPAGISFHLCSQPVEHAFILSAESVANTST